MRRRAARLSSRVPYQQTEVFRFRQSDRRRLGGQGEFWPLDEGADRLCRPDPMAAPTDENPLAVLNVIANPKLLIGGEEVDASVITPDLPREQAAGGRGDRY